jgi:creatinine amidohydrolase
VRDVLKETVRHGARRILLLNAHYENTYFLYESADLAMQESTVRKAKIVVVNWWELLTDDDVREVFPEGFPGWPAEHAGVCETSLVLLFRPELVRQDRIVDDKAPRTPPYMMFPPDEDTISKSGVMYRPSLATVEKGKTLADKIEKALVELVRREFPVNPMK